MLKLCAFDLDGTLVNSLSDIHRSLNHALTVNGFAPCDAERIPRLIGHSVAWMCRTALPENARDAHWQAVFDAFNDHYRFHCCDETAPYPGVMELLTKLRAADVTLAVVSNKPHRECIKVMHDLFPNDLFSLALGRIEKFALKPEPEPLRFAVDYFGVSDDEAAYVGDSEVDIAFAQNAHLRCVSVCWGTRSKEELFADGASCVAETAEEAYRLLMG